eukprot:m.194779 g.194779  ORF g.194779 m.194779 type:complete len:237 (+) comp18663_c0_seq2:262-972(+)
MAANVGPGSSASVDVVLDESDKYVLDVSSTNQHSMWLLKVPQADLAAAIETALDREEIGFLKELVEPIVESKRTAAASSDRPRKKPKCEIDVAESLAERFDGRRRIAAEVAAEKEGTSVIHPVAVNRHYDMAFRDRKESMAVFSEETQDDGGIKSVALEGKIVANAHTSLQDFATIRKRIDTVRTTEKRYIRGSQLGILLETLPLVSPIVLTILSLRVLFLHYSVRFVCNSSSVLF